MSPNLFILALLPKNAYFLLVGANLPPRLIPSLLLLIQPARSELELKLAVKTPHINLKRAHTIVD